MANHPGVKVDLDRWITQVRRVMAERDAYKEQPATGHGGTKDATSDSRARESAPEFRPAREGTVDTVTTTGSTTKKSAKMPDPPIFEGFEGSIDLQDWLIRITSTLQANAVVFRCLGDVREMFRLFFVRVSLGHNKAEFSDPQIQIGLYAGMVGHAQHCSLGTPGGVLSSMLVMASCIIPNVESGSSIREVGYRGATRHLDLLGYGVRDGHAFLGGSS
ncbi:hypothetical protein E4U23_002047 [Claviceps purpurea]|nr:hypothetical protein E4U23_002047 [Claviceps purpurea]